MFKDRIISFLDDFNEIVVEVGIKVVPIIVPLPSVIGLINAMAHTVDLFSAIVTGAVIELFGMAAVDNSYQFWNRRNKLPEWLAYGITIAYVLIAEAVIYGYKIHGQSIVNIVFMLFPLLSILGFLLMVNRKMINQVDEETISQSDSQHNELVSNLDSLNKRVAEQKVINANLTNDLSEAQSTISQLTGTIDSLNLSITDSQRLSSELSEALSKNELYSSEIDRLKEELTGLKIDNAGLSATVKSTVTDSVNRVSIDSINRVSIDSRKDIIITSLDSDSDTSIAELVRLTGASRNTIKNDLSELGYEVVKVGKKWVIQKVSMIELPSVLHSANGYHVNGASK